MFTKGICIYLRLLNVVQQSALYMAMLHKHHHSVALLHAAGCKLNKREEKMLKLYEESIYPDKKRFYGWAKKQLNSPMTLGALSRVVIRDNVAHEPHSVSELPLPKCTKKFLLLHDVMSSEDVANYW